jgi:DNA-binding IclR family transcriptional regulator
MFIKNKLDPIDHIISVLEREDLILADKVFMITLLIEPSIHLGFSIKKYSTYLGISKSTLYRSMDRLSELKILKKNGKRYKYIIDCKLL